MKTIKKTNKTTSIRIVLVCCILLTGLFFPIHTLQMLELIGFTCAFVCAWHAYSYKFPMPQLIITLLLIAKINAMYMNAEPGGSLSETLYCMGDILLGCMIAMECILYIRKKNEKESTDNS